MDTETTQQIAGHLEDEEESGSNPERPPHSPITAQRNANGCNETSNVNNTEAENETSDIVMGSVGDQSEESQTAGGRLENTGTEVNEHMKNSQEYEQINSEANEVRVKDEPGCEDTLTIDYGMPIAKTPRHPSQMQDTDMETTVLTVPAEPSYVGHEMGFDFQSSCGDYLDGLATPIASTRPHLRVKSEFSSIPQEGEANSCEYEAMDTEISLPPPPPLISNTIADDISTPRLSLSSTSNMDFVADGIATPRLSLTVINRLRVKPEFNEMTKNDNEESSSVPPGDHEKEAGEVSDSSGGYDTEDENIPQDFFDDLLHDKVKEKIQEAQNNELEEKYSDRLKEMARLEKEKKEARKQRKKQKKSKKKTRKRSRSCSLSPNTRNHDKPTNDFEGSSSHDRAKRTRVTPPRQDMPTQSNPFRRVVREQDYSIVDMSVRVKTEFGASHLENAAQDNTTAVKNVEEIEEVLTPKQKREGAIIRVQVLLNQLQRSSADSSIFSSFPFVSTVRRLPTSHSYVQQQIYENRSPLHTVNNVSYMFNSHANRFNMEEWGLAALSPHAAKLAKLVGCDAQYIQNKLKTIKIPAKLSKVKQEATINQEEGEEDEEELIITTSSLYCNAMTQTDDDGKFGGSSNTRGYEIGVQVEPDVYSIGCQTLETISPTKNIHQDDETPIMQIIRDLNENQLMAIHQFAELIKTSNHNTNAMEMYKIQKQISDIYKISQIPSVLATPQQPQHVNNYTTKSTNHLAPNRGNSQMPPQQQRREYVQQQPHQQYNHETEGSRFSANDPRARSSAYANRVMANDAGSLTSSASNFADPRYAGYSQSSHDSVAQMPSHARLAREDGRYFANSNSFLPSHQFQYPVSNQTPPTITKHYGRGGLRR